MTVFIVFSGLLLAGALLWVVLPLLRGNAIQPTRTQEQAGLALAVLREQIEELDSDLAAGRIDEAAYARNREEVERRALEEGQSATAEEAKLRTGSERNWAILLMVLVPALTAAGYLSFGNLDGLDPAQAESEHSFTAADLQNMAGQLEQRLQQEPDNAQGWMMLARTYMVLQDFPKAAGAYERLAQVMPDDPDVLADWADVVAAMRGTVVGEAEQLVTRALEIAPTHPKSLALAGTAAFQREDYATAAELWERILAHISPEEEAWRGILGSVNDARTKAGLPPLDDSAVAAAPAPASPLSLSGRIEVDPLLAGELAPDDVVFIFARGEEGGPPLAALRYRAAELPREFSFAEAPLIMAEANLPAAVVVGARVSKSGSATAASGDVEGLIETPVAIDAVGLALRLDRIRP